MGLLDPGDTVAGRLVRRLRSQSEEFARLWDAHDVEVERSASKRLHHPLVGWLDLDCEALHDPDRDQWLILYSAPPGTPTHDALRLLAVVGTQDVATPG